ncbi:MAG: leucyl aminopeptidase family protein, partial [Pseudomonadota bacterium]
MIDRNALIQPDRGQQAIALHLVDKAALPDFLKGLNTGQRASLAAQKFEGGGYEHGIVPDGDGWFAVAGVANVDNLSSWCLAKLADVLPGGTYRLAGGEPGKALHGWVTGQYRFDRYRKDAKDTEPRILLTNDVARIDAALAEASAVLMVRDLVNTPAEDMGPAALEAAAEK